MRRQAIVIGLGQFGMTVAGALAARDVEVLAIDRHPDRVRIAASFAAEALCFDATDTAAIEGSSPERRDACVCAIGDESREAAIICTALLRQFGARRVIARANDEVHARILKLVGAHQVVNPEREFGERFANQILYQGIRGELPVGDDLVITEIDVPVALAGHTLASLQLPKHYGVTVVAIRRAGGGSGAVSLPGPTAVLEAGCSVVLVSQGDAVAKMLERIGS
ncbi:MAG: TrkA family potassium uptake protein [Planctomycetota bacterium]